MNRHSRASPLFVIPQRPIACHSAAPHCLSFRSAPLLVIPQRSGGICFCSCRCLFLLVIPAQPLKSSILAQPLKSSFWRSQNLCICLVFLMLTASTLPNDEKTQ
jgi:hypothetical protein